MRKSIDTLSYLVEPLLAQKPASGNLARDGDSMESLARASRARLHRSSVHGVVVHRITPITTMAKPSHHARQHSRRVALTDTLLRG
ncbi:hypothetical protein [Caballeronia hypogeia]|uniref:hypothetical protein n=1 Tax=Caballeronia hypogeia TaxID=1777140 RepID=UPI0018DF3D10